MTKKRLSGFKKIHVAPVADGTFSTPVPILGAKSIEAELNYESVQFYSDDVMDTNENLFAGGEGTLTVSSLTLEEYQTLFGATYDAGGVLVKTTDIAPEVAILFERGKLGSNGKMLYSIYACKFAPASISAVTREGTAEEEPVELSFTVRETADNEVYFIVDSEDADADSTMVSGWYETVQKPGAAAGVSIQSQAKKK